MWADYFVCWLAAHPESEAFADFVKCLSAEYYVPDEYGSVHVWDFFFGWGSAEEFLSAWFENEQEAADFRRYLEAQGAPLE